MNQVKSPTCKQNPDGVSLWINHASQPVEVDFAAIASGHLWPETDAQARKFFPSPWTGLMDAQISACRVGISGHLAQRYRRGDGRGQSAWYLHHQ
ncbi:Uncharacterised protein [Citrobacter freundii]|nr:Uncharacterised protein [Citrobacter freundii]